MALALDVHAVLGRTRQGEPLGSPPAAPLAGGLRIGKAADFGPDCDGQYWHYLTRWLFALRQLALALPPPPPPSDCGGGGDAGAGGPGPGLDALGLALQLAEAVQPRFVHAAGDPGGGSPHIFWKMDVRLSRPLVPSQARAAAQGDDRKGRASLNRPPSRQGNLDAFDGWVTYRLLAETAAARGRPGALAGPVAALEACALHQLRTRGPFRSDDPLDLGESLACASWYPGEAWAAAMTSSAFASLERLHAAGRFDAAPSRRLAFRELGVCIGAARAAAAHYTSPA